MVALTLPLADWADLLLKRLAQATGSAAIAALDGATLLGERAMLFRFLIPGRTSSGGGCRLYDAHDGTIALNLARQVDRELLPALFERELPELHNDAAIAAAVAGCEATALVTRGRMMGMAIAAEHEPAPPAGSACSTLTVGRSAATQRRATPRVLDLSALWAGPLAAHLLWLAGAEVIRVESRARPDRLRDSDQSFYDLLNQGKALLPLDFNASADRSLLLSLLADADIVIEASRPRALLQLGIDADQLVRANPGLTWITITAHGAQGAAADWVGFGDDCGVAAGLSAELRAATGQCGFVGDAIADPLTGVRAALAAWEQWQARGGARLGIAMTAVVAEALGEARRVDSAAFTASLRAWGAAVGQRYPIVRRRDIGKLVRFNRIDQSPAQGSRGIDPAAGQHQ